MNLKNQSIIACKSVVLALFLVLLFALSSCNQDDSTQSPPTPIATSEQTTLASEITTPQSDGASNINRAAALTQTAAHTQTTALPSALAASPVPQPTLRPSEQLEHGLRQLRYGDFAAARQIFLALLDAPVEEPEIQVQARFDLARAYMAEGLYEDGLTTLEFFSDAAQVDGPLKAMLAPKALLLRAQAYQALSDHAAALSAYQQVLTSYPWASEALEPQVAQASLLLGDSVAASAAYQRAANAATSARDKVRWLEQVALVHNNAGRYMEAVAVYDEILSIAQNADYRAEIQYRVGQSLAVAGDESNAIVRWRSATEESPESRSAYLALVELINRNVEFDSYLRGYIDLNSEAWYPAISAYQNFLATAPISDTRYARAVHEMGQSQLGAGEFDVAIATFDRVITDFPQCSCFGQAWMDKARAQVFKEDHSAGRRTYRTFAREHGGDPLAAEALWQSGVRALRDDNELEAAADFLTLADSFPQSPRAPIALYAVGVGALQSKYYTQAANLYGQLQANYPNQQWDAVAYWLGRAHDATGNPGLAQTQWLSLTQRSPDIYYGVLAAMALSKTSTANGAFLIQIEKVAGPPSSLAEDDGSQAFAEQWLQSMATMRGDNLFVLSATVDSDVDLLQGRLLLEIDQRYEGLVFLNRLYERYASDLRAMLALSLEFERIGAYRLSLLSMQRVVQSSPARWVEDAPIFLQQRIYPRPFAELIEKEAIAHNLNPLLYYSLIRQESLFEEGARSGAAAQGLAQIIPDTALWVAQQMGHPDWSNELIYRPYINLQFGAFYLDWTRDYLDGNLVSALVGYNAGPGNAEYWRELSGADDMLFVEILGVNEPRIYVQTVTTNLYHYTRLYGEK